MMRWRESSTHCMASWSPLTNDGTYWLYKSIGGIWGVSITCSSRSFLDVKPLWQIVQITWWFVGLPNFIFLFGVLDEDCLRLSTRPVDEDGCSSLQVFKWRFRLKLLENTREHSWHSHCLLSRCCDRTCLNMLLRDEKDFWQTSHFSVLGL